MYRRDIGVIDDIEEIGEKKRYIYETFFEIQYSWNRIDIVGEIEEMLEK